MNAASKTYYYIEPSVLHFPQELISKDDEELVAQFVYDFEEMLSTLDPDKHKIIMDRSIGKHLIDDSNNVLIPLKISEIRDPTLRKTVCTIQRYFFKIIPPMVTYVQTDTCSFVRDNVDIYPIDNRILFKKKYYCDFFHSILGECYRISNISERILIMPNFTQIIGDQILLECQCPINEKSKKLYCCPIESLINKKNKAKKTLKAMLKVMEPVTQNDVDVVQAKHAPIIGHTVITRYTEIPSRLREVLNFLIPFGMNRLELREWGSHKGQKGSLHNCSIPSEQIDLTCDILIGWLIVEDRSCKCVMYFPKGIPNLLIDIIGSDINYIDIVTLKDELF